MSFDLFNHVFDKHQLASARALVSAQLKGTPELCRSEEGITSAQVIVNAFNDASVTDLNVQPRGAEAKPASVGEIAHGFLLYVSDMIDDATRNSPNWRRVILLMVGTQSDAMQRRISMMMLRYINEDLVQAVGHYLSRRITRRYTPMEGPPKEVSRLNEIWTRFAFKRKGDPSDWVDELQGDDLREYLYEALVNLDTVRYSLRYQASEPYGQAQAFVDCLVAAQEFCCELNNDVPGKWAVWEWDNEICIAQFALNMGLKLHKIGERA